MKVQVANADERYRKTDHLIGYVIRKNYSDIIILQQSCIVMTVNIFYYPQNRDWFQPHLADSYSSHIIIINWKNLDEYQHLFQKSKEENDLLFVLFNVDFMMDLNKFCKT